MAALLAILMAALMAAVTAVTRLSMRRNSVADTGNGNRVSKKPIFPLDYGLGSYKPKIQFKKSYEMLPFYGKGSGKQYQVRVPQDYSPVKVMFLTQNTPVHIQQKHKRGQPEYKKATTHEEPHVVVHEVIKPVIQEIREIIVPYRKVIQKIEPVQEERKTIVHKDDLKDNGGDKYKYQGDNERYEPKYQEKYQDKYDDKYGEKYGQEERTSYKKYDLSSSSSEDKYKESRVVSSTVALDGALGNTGLTLAAIFGQKTDQKSS